MRVIIVCNTVRIRHGKLLYEEKRTSQLILACIVNIDTGINHEAYIDVVKILQYYFSFFPSSPRVVLMCVSYQVVR